MRKLLLFTLALSLPACSARINKQMGSWMGQHESELIASWGPPDRVIEDGHGGRILAWVAERATSSGSAQHWENMTTAQATTSTRRSYRMFWVNRDGVVYRWAWRGL